MQYSRLKLHILFIFLWAPFLLSGTFTINHDKDQIRIERKNDFHHVDYQGIHNLSALNDALGKPDLPEYVFRIVLEGSTAGQDISIESVSRRKLEGEFRISPRQEPWHQGMAKSTGVISFEGYNYEGLYPARILEFTGIKFFNGVPIAHVLVRPFQYDAEQKELYFIESISFSLQTSGQRQKGIEREKAFSQTEDDTRDRSLLQIPQSVTDADNRSAAEINIEYDVSAPVEQTISTEQFFRYAIITTEALKDEMQTLRHWKNRRGVPSAIWTIGEIEAQFPRGADQAERVRNFIRWAYQMRGLKYVLLAGDTELVPSRIIRAGRKIFPSDYYYADLDGSWNADEDDIFAEKGDQVDGYPEIYVGRLPVKTKEEVQRFFDKFFQYVKMPFRDGAYPTNALYMAANLSYSGDSEGWITNHIDPRIAPEFERTWLTQDDHVGSDPQVALDALRQNYGLIFTECHGLYHTIRPGARGSNIYTYQLDDMGNTRPGVWYVASCYTNDIRKRAFSELYLLGENGGGAAYIANTDYEYPRQSLAMQSEFYNLIFNKGRFHLSEAHYLSRLKNLGYLWSEVNQIIVYSTLVLGDPQMPVWTKEPQDFEMQVLEEPQEESGLLKLKVTNKASGKAVEGATVTIYPEDYEKDNQTYIIMKTGADGIARTSFNGRDAGAFLLTVSKHNYRPHEQGLLLKGVSKVALASSALRIEEQGSYSNGQVEPGESFKLILLLKNQGDESLPAGGRLILKEYPSALKVTNEKIDALPEIAPGDSLWIDTFDMEVTSTVQKDTTLNLALAVETDQMQYGAFGIKLPVYRPNLLLQKPEVHTADFGEDAEWRYLSRIRPEVYNAGRGAAYQISATITDVNRPADISRATTGLEDIQPGRRRFTDSELLVRHNIAVDSLRLTLAVNSKLQAGKQVLSFKAPSAPEQIDFEPLTAGAIQLSWNPAAEGGILGYNIYRCSSSDTVFKKINESLVPNAGYYVDHEAIFGGTYYYKLQGVDSSGYPSPLSKASRPAWSSLPYQSKFPVELGTKAISSGRNGTAVFDFNADGQKEIVASGARGVLKMFDPQGNMLFSVQGMDGELTEPAVGNVWGDAGREIVVSAYRERLQANFVYVINPNNGELIHTFDLGYNAPTAVVLNDLDHDGRNEIMVLTHGNNHPDKDMRVSRLYIWEYEDSQWKTFGNWPPDGFVESSSFSLGVPASANLEGDGTVSILLGTSAGRLYKFNPADSSNAQWMLELGGIINSALSIADLDLDDRKEIVVPAIQEDKIFVITPDGRYKTGWEEGRPAEVTNIWGMGAPAVVGNLDMDAMREVVYVGRRHVYIFEHDGTLKEGWPRELVIEKSQFQENNIVGTPVLADLNRDEIPEIIFVTVEGILHAWDANSGENIRGFPIPTGMNIVDAHSPQVNDVDGDGDLDILYTDHGGTLHIWDAPAQYNQSVELVWNQPFANIRHTGELDTLEIGQVSAIDDPSAADLVLPGQYSLSDNYPDPFNPNTRFTVRLPKAALVELEIFNTLGQMVANPVQTVLTAGQHTIEWHANQTKSGVPAASGVYFYRLKFKDAQREGVIKQITGKMVLLK